MDGSSLTSPFPNGLKVRFDCRPLGSGCRGGPFRFFCWAAASRATVMRGFAICVGRDCFHEPSKYMLIARSMFPPAAFSSCLSLSVVSLSPTMLVKSSASKLGGSSRIGAVGSALTRESGGGELGWRSYKWVPGWEEGGGIP